MLNEERTRKMLCDLFTLCGQYKNEVITQEQFFSRAEKLAEVKLKAEGRSGFKEIIAKRKGGK